MDATSINKKNPLSLAGGQKLWAWEQRSALAKNAKPDLAHNSMTCNHLSEKTDSETEHGDTAVELFSLGETLGLNLSFRCILKPGIVNRRLFRHMVEAT